MAFIGTRVIRGPHWTGKNEDAGPGGLGTVVAAYESVAKVKVIWDVGNKGIYKAGADDKYELRIYDNAPTGVSQTYVTCDKCQENPIMGIRWKCMTCDDFDLCTSCYMQHYHDTRHKFLRYLTRNSIVYPVNCQNQHKRIRLRGILPGAHVVRGVDWEWGDDDGGNSNSGEVMKLVKWGSKSYKGGVRITWDNGMSSECRMGADGKVDLSFIGESELHYCHPDLLPVLDITVMPEGDLKKGDKVTIINNVKIVQKIMAEIRGWNEGIRNYVNKVATVVGFARDNNALPEIQYPDTRKLVMSRSVIERITSLKVGDVIRIIDRPNSIMEQLMDGHGGWVKDMAEIRGKLAKIKDVDEDGDIVVVVEGAKRWILNPVCCEPVNPDDLSPDEKNELSSSSDSRSVSSCSSSISDVDDIEDTIQETLLEILHEGVESKGNLVAAASQGDFSLVQRLVNEDESKVDMVVGNKTALQMACYKGHANIVRFLISKNASVDLADDEGDSPLHMAVSGKHLNIVMVLCDNGADIEAINHTKLTPFHMAVRNQSYEIAEYLVNSDCNVNTQDQNGNTPLHEALDNLDDQPMINMLLSRSNLRVDIPNSKGMTAIHLAITNSAIDRLLIQVNSKRLLIQLISKVNNLDQQRTTCGSYTPLHIAAINGNMSLAACLLKQKHSVDPRDSSGKTPLHLAVITKSEPMVDILLTNDANINSQDNDGNTPLHLSVSDISLDKITQSVMGKVNPNGNSGSDLAYTLIINKANVHIKNSNGKTALDLIQNEDHRHLLRRIANSTAKQPNTRSERQMEFPQYWQTMESEDRCRRVVITKDTAGASEEYQRIHQLFSQTLSNRQILKMERIQNVDKWEAFAVKKKSMERTLGVGLTGERYLFHGTKPERVKSIIASGLDFRLVENGLYGNGAYFAVKSKTSDGYTVNDEQNKRYMFVAKTLVGKYAFGERDMKVPPQREDNPDVQYDSVVDNTEEPAIFVLFDNSQIYTEYLITYQ